MADPSKLKRDKTGLGAPPTSGPGNVDKAEEEAKEKKHKGRPKLDYPTQQLGARVHEDTFKRVQAISRRERVGLGPLVDRMVAAWERQRLAEAEAVGPRREGEDDDTYIARIFKL